MRSVSKEVENEIKQLSDARLPEVFKHYTIPFSTKDETFFVYQLKHAEAISMALNLPYIPCYGSDSNNKVHVAIDDCSFDNLSRAYDCIFNFINQYNLHSIQNKTPLITTFKVVRPSEIKENFNSGQTGKY